MGDYATGDYARLIFRKRRTVRIVLCAGLAAGAGAAFVMEAPLWAPIGMALAAALWGVLLLSPDYIFAAPHGLEHRSLMDRQIWRWEEVGDFDLTETRLNVPLVTFNSAKDPDRRRAYFKAHGVDANVGLSGPWTEDGQTVATGLALAKARWTRT